MVERYPAYNYVHQLETNPLQEELIRLVRAEEEKLYLLREGRFTKSQDVEKALSPHLATIGFSHSVTNQQVSTLFSPGSDFEIDFFHPGFRVALEVEKGKHFNVWRDVCKFVESTQIDHAVILIPLQKTNQQGESEKIFFNTLDALQNVSRLYQGLKSLLVIGY